MKIAALGALLLSAFSTNFLVVQAAQADPSQNVTVWMNDTRIVYTHNGQSYDYEDYLNATLVGPYFPYDSACLTGTVLWDTDTATLVFDGSTFLAAYHQSINQSTVYAYLDGEEFLIVGPDGNSTDTWGCGAWRVWGGEVEYGRHNFTVQAGDDGLYGGYWDYFVYTGSPTPPGPVTTKRSDKGRIIGGVVAGVVALLGVIAFVILRRKNLIRRRLANYPRRGFLVLPEDRKQAPPHFPSVVDDKGGKSVVVEEGTGVEPSTKSFGQYELDELAMSSPQAVATVPGFERSTMDQWKQF